MPIPTDHGRVVIKDELDGTKTIIVCSDIVGGRPINAYAMHVRSSKVLLDPAVEMNVAVVGGSGSRETATVFVDDDGAVHVMPALPLLKV
jgi:hypothetical protein